MLGCPSPTIGPKIVFVGVVFFGCSHDWTVPPKDGGAAPPTDAASLDASDGSDASEDASDASTSACPDGMVPIDGASCIDATEVTQARYRSFLATKPDGAKLPAGCAWKTSFEPKYWTSDDNMPIASVDQCDARAFCTWSGKALCGRSAWQRACSAGGSRTYPYGADAVAQRCNDTTQHRTEPLPVRSLPDCEGGVPGLFDMSGNVYEWVAECAGDTGPSDACTIAGGSFQGGSGACDDTSPERRDTRYTDVGFRCCTP